MLFGGLFMRNLVAILLLASSMSALAEAPAAPTASTPASTPASTSELPTPLPAGIFKASKSALSLKNGRALGIGQFSVVFLTKKIDYDGGGFLSVGGEGKAVGHLQGVSGATMQKITDDIYADFTTGMGKNGIVIDNGSAIKAVSNWAKVKQIGQGSEVFVMLKKKDKADGLAYFPTAIGHTGNMILQSGMFDFSMGQMATASYMAANESGMPVVNIVYVVDFAAPAKSRGGGLFQNMQVKAELAMSTFGTQMRFSLPKGKYGDATLTAPIIEGGNFADIEDKTGDANKAIDKALKIGMALFGGPSTGNLQRRFYYNVTDQNMFAAKAVSSGRRANDGIVALFSDETINR